MTVFQFSEAARLYARDFQIVDSVKRQFDQDVKSFLDAVRDEVRSLRKPEMKEKVQPTGNRFWWLSGASEKNPLQLWLEAKKTHAAIIKDEKLQFSAVAHEAPAEKKKKKKTYNLGRSQMKPPRKNSGSMYNSKLARKLHTFASPPDVAARG